MLALPPPAPSAPAAAAGAAGCFRRFANIPWASLRYLGAGRGGREGCKLRHRTAELSCCMALLPIESLLAIRTNLYVRSRPAALGLSDPAGLMPGTLHACASVISSQPTCQTAVPPACPGGKGRAHPSAPPPPGLQRSSSQARQAPQLAAEPLPATASFSVLWTGICSPCKNSK